MAAEAFTDSLDRNLEIIGEIISGMPPGAQQRAKRAGMKIQKIIEDIRKDDPKDPAVAIGVTWAVHFAAQYLCESSRNGEDKPLIQLLT